MKFWTIVLLVCFAAHVCIAAEEAKKETKEKKPKISGKEKRRIKFMKEFHGPVQEGPDAHLEMNYLKTIFKTETSTVDPATYATLLAKSLDGSFDHPEDKEHFDSGVPNPLEHAQAYVKEFKVQASYSLEDVLDDLNEGNFHFWIETRLNPETDDDL